MTETDLSNEIKRALQDQKLVVERTGLSAGTYNPKIRYDYMRLESHTTVLGLPDVNLCVEDLDKDSDTQCATEIWLELKIGSETPRPLQISWARRRWELGQHNIYCIRGYQTMNREVAAFVEPMNIYWAEYKPLPSMVMTLDRLAYFLLTGEEYRDK